MNAGHAQHGGMMFGFRRTWWRRRGTVARSSVALLLATIVLCGCESALAAPGDYEIEAFGGPNYTGKSEVFKLDPQQSQQWVQWDSQMGEPWIVSIKVGKKVGVLLQKREYWHPKDYPTYAILTEDTPSLSGELRRSTDVMVFNKGANKGTLPGGKIQWERPHPDGVLFNRYSSNTLVGGTDPDVPHQFFSPYSQYPGGGPPQNETWAAHTVRKFDLHWVQIWGKTTHVKIVDNVGHSKTYTTDGKDEAELDLSGSIVFQHLATMEVGIAQGGSAPGGSAPDPATAWARWEFKHICFKQFAKGIWVEYQNGNPTFWFTELERKPDYVELLDKDRNMRVRLYADRIATLSPAYNPQYVPQYPGGGWRDPRDFWLFDIPGGYFFRKAQGKNWDHFVQGQKNDASSFSETARTPEYVELYDANQQKWLRLWLTRGESRTGGVNEPWVSIQPGRWALDEAPSKGGSVGPPPATLVAPDIGGTWLSSVGVLYHLNQAGMSFTWTAPQLGHNGAGNVLSGTELSAQWTDAAGNQSATGKITGFDSKGKPTRIEWSNGVTFTRPAGAAPPSQPAVPVGGDLTGVWMSNAGVEYHFKQNGFTFTWSAPQLNESGQGNLYAGHKVSAKWSGNLGNQSADGKVTQFDAQGRPSRIEWENGQVFTRKGGAVPPQQGAVTLAGTWVSTFFNTVYQIQQNGTNFSWTAATLNESAQGKLLAGNTVSVTWSGKLGSGSAKGKITQIDAQGKATRIEWDNGHVFTRQ
jgi:hypothetical protein